VPAQALLAQAFEGGKVVACVCHGPVCLANVKLSSGKYLIDNKKVRFLTLLCGMCSVTRR
jgi:putative intracellular protease/amidase